MSNNHTTLTGLFTDIANAIRSKTGTTEAIVADEFPTAIAAIENGGGIDTCTITVTGYNPNGYSGYVVTQVIDGEITVSSSGSKLKEATVVLTNVVCGSFLYFSGYDVLAANCGGGVIRLTDLPLRMHYLAGFIAPKEAGANGTIEIVED